MSDKIKLVAGDTRPWIKVTLKDVDGNPINVAGSTVYFKFRQSGTTATLFTTTCAQPNGGADGVVAFNFPAGGLDVAAGQYEGEIEIAFTPTDIQTVYELIKFTVREQFA
jgi:hypothetical protein